MIPHPPDNAPGRSPSPREELSHWLGIVHRLPDMRVHKVLNARQAIQRRVYDDNADVLDRTIDRLCWEIGVTLREEL